MIIDVVEEEETAKIYRTTVEENRRSGFFLRTISTGWRSSEGIPYENT